MHPTKPPICHLFMPATHSLAFGMIQAAFTDIRQLMRQASEILLDIWLDAVYSTACYFHRART